MIINKLNQLYKPKRTLYYLDASAEDIHSFYNGTVPPSVEKYADAFGTYDHPGLFFIRSLQKEVIGIEFRNSDPRIEYPTELRSLELDAAYFYSVEIDDDAGADLPFIRALFKEIAEEDNAHRLYSDLVIDEESEVISVFHGYKKLRILHEWKIYSDRAVHVIRDDFDHFKKEDLYRSAFTDVITGNYNWNHLEAFLEVPADGEIRDYAFAHFDIKQFRVINEAYGHMAANKVLSNVVKAMNEADFVYSSARCHNDNFAMLLRDMPEPELKKRLQDFF